MGSENSKRSREKRDVPTSENVQEVIENQRILYEIQYQELRNGYLQNQIINRSQLNQNNQSNNPSRATLYPNLNVVNNNIQTTAVYSRPSTSYTPSSPNDPGSSYGASTSSSPTSSYHRPRPIPSAPPAPLTQTTEIKQTSLPVTKPPSSNSARKIAPKKNGRSILDCVTCKNDLHDQIYQCKNGHSSCKECRLKKAHCGVCSQMITAMRNITLEATLADMKTTTTTTKTTIWRRIKCPHEGCKVVMNENTFENHSKECRFKEMSCASMGFLGLCTWKGKLDQLVDHFNEFHKEHREAHVDKEMSLTNITEDEKILYLVNIGNFNFLLHIQINSSQETVSMVVQLIGAKKTASRWLYEINVYSKQDVWKRHQYIDTCHSHAESVQEIIDAKNCAVLSTKYAKSFFRNKQLFYKFYIRRDHYSRFQNRPN